MGINNWLRTIRVKLLHWEYWPIELIYLPASIYYVYLMIRAGHAHFYSTANPNIETGGMFFESKWQIYQQIPTHLIPKTILIPANADSRQVMQSVRAAGINFPCIVKPDRGEKGWLVSSIDTMEDLMLFLQKHPIDMLVQDKVLYPLEFGVFYVKLPGQAKGMITSLVLKKSLTVTGDGHSSIAALIDRDDRAFLVREALAVALGDSMKTVLPKGTAKEIMSFGNHIRGARFENGARLIHPAMNELFNNIAESIPGFYFGRFDVKCANETDLYTGKQLSIIELNGAGAIPGHILDPSYSYWRAQLDISQHMYWMYCIARHQHNIGLPYLSWRQYLSLKKAERQYKKQAQCIY